MADRTPVMVAAIGLIGVVTAAAIANPKNVRDLLGLSGETKQETARPDRAPVIDVPEPKEGPTETQTGAANPNAPSTPADIGGRWHSEDGYDFMFTQTGAGFTYFRMDDRSDRGSGRIVGTALTYNFTAPEGPGSCQAMLDTVAHTIAGTCTRAGQSWPLNLRRPTPRELHRSL